MTIHSVLVDMGIIEKLKLGSKQALQKKDEGVFQNVSAIEDKRKEMLSPRGSNEYQQKQADRLNTVLRKRH